MSEQTISTAWDAARAFFDLPPAEKSKARAPFAGYPYGYLGAGVEALARSKGADTPPDLTESFSIGTLALTAGLKDPEALAFCYADTIWPPAPDGFVAAWKAYYAAMEDLASRIMRVFAMALKLPEDHFAGVIDRPVSALRALNYPHPTAPPEPGQLSRRRPHRLWQPDDPVARSEVRRPRNLHAGAAMAPGAAGARRLHHQYRRPDGAVDQRPLGVDAAPRGQPAARRQGIDTPAILRLLPPAQLGRRDRVPEILPGPRGDRALRPGALRPVSDGKVQVDREAGSLTDGLAPLCRSRAIATASCRCSDL